MNRILFALFALPLLSFTTAAAADGPKTLPSYLSLPPALHPANSQSTTYQDYGEAEFDTHASDSPLLLKGHYWHVNFVLDNPSHTDDTAVLWAAIKPALVKGGWTVSDEFTTGHVVRYQKNGKDVRAEFSIPSSDQIQMDIAVGTPIAGRPPHRSTRAGFPHVAPTSSV